ncbi:MAG: DUF1615 domain-containing protein [Lysobacterales bacterium]
MRATTRNLLLALATLGLMLSCSKPERPRSPAEVRARIVQLLPARLRDREGWATDIRAAFASLAIEPTDSNICAALAVTEQESTFTPDPEVPGLARIARAEIERRASRLHVPRFLVRRALRIKSPNGKSYEARLAAVRTEHDLNLIYLDLIHSLPLGKRLLAGANPVHTAGPMQVSIEFAEQHAKDHPYPYTVERSIRHEVFTRRGGLYFGIAHLLGYPSSYKSPLYRFADFNAGWYASRNAAFQRAASLASGIDIPFDGDLVDHDLGLFSKKAGKTEAAVRSLAGEIEMSNTRIRLALRKGESLRFEKTELYERVFALAEHRIDGRLRRAMLPRINLESPKITRKLTTEWFATRVDARYHRCLAKARGR